MVNTLSEDRTAGVIALEEKQDLQDKKSHRHLPGSISLDILPSDIQYNFRQEVQQPHNLDYIAIGDIKQQLLKNRPYLGHRKEPPSFQEFQEFQEDSLAIFPNLSSTETVTMLNSAKEEPELSPRPHQQNTRSSNSPEEVAAETEKFAKNDKMVLEGSQVLTTSSKEPENLSPNRVLGAQSPEGAPSSSSSSREISPIDYQADLEDKRLILPNLEHESLNVRLEGKFESGNDPTFIDSRRTSFGSTSEPNMNNVPETTETVTYCILCEIRCTLSMRVHDHHRYLIFEDVPQLGPRSKFASAHFDGRKPVVNYEKYVRDSGAGFIVLRQYSCADANYNAPVARDQEPNMREKQKQTLRHIVRGPLRLPEVFLDSKDRQSIKEKINVHSEILISKIQEVAEYEPGELTGMTDGRLAGPLKISFPYKFIFQHRSKLREHLAPASDILGTQISSLLEYSESCQGDKYRRIDAQFQAGKLTEEGQYFLFKINEVVVYQEKDACSAYVITNFSYWDSGWAIVQFHCWSWVSNGSELKRQSKVIDMQWPKNEAVEINSLKVYPLSYALPETRQLLLQQGKKYWGLRFQHKVAYSGWDVPQDQKHHESRFMVDQRTFHKYHPTAAAFQFIREAPLPYDSRPSEIMLDTELEEIDYILCPNIIQGFFLAEKHWVSLYVSQIEPVKWNKEAFERLVLPSRTKELIKALVMRTGSKGSNQRGICGGKRQDIIAGKGTGLMVLLHGGPGTGKTLTAESVAELAEMPLYSVTCGDIGTEPEAVEEYLKRVLYFGKTWNCVLLLDEADVFLEERGLQDLKRNSLVSVFLRILEYYSGILILTTNRVGSFDEAFKSRIQLALRYPDPDPTFRKKIWMNFFDMLETDEEDVDLEELKEHLDELSDQEMNGREIRNSLTTARQLASYKNTTLGWTHLNQAVKTAKEFNKYLVDVQGLTNKDWARELNLR